jgi:hypothetical protein
MHKPQKVRISPKRSDAVVLREAPKDSWRKWAGRFAGSGLTEELAASRREEIARDAQSLSIAAPRSERATNRNW